MSDIYKQIAQAGESIAAEKAQEAYGIARARVQEDFNNELVDFVAGYTGHPTLSKTVFAVVNLNSIHLDVEKYTDPDYILGVFSSNSDFHPGFADWRRVSKLRGMSKDEFWDRKLSGELGGGDYGGVESDWLTDNFWSGIVVGTNGWPRGEAEFLSVIRSRGVSGKSAVDQYVKNYNASGRYPAYIREAMASFM